MPGLLRNIYRLEALFRGLAAEIIAISNPTTLPGSSESK